MTKRIVASVVLCIMVVFLSWYAYQEYKRYQRGPLFVVESAER